MKLMFKLIDDDNVLVHGLETKITSLVINGQSVVCSGMLNPRLIEDNNKSISSTDKVIGIFFIIFIDFIILPGSIFDNSLTYKYLWKPLILDIFLFKLVLDNFSSVLYEYLDIIDM